MALEPAKLPRPIESFQLLCVRCRPGLYYVRQDRELGVLVHHLACRRCGQKHAAWTGWEPYQPQGNRTKGEMCPRKLPKKVWKLPSTRISCSWSRAAQSHS